MVSKIIDSNYINEAVTISNLVDVNGNENLNYGYHFWIAKRKGFSIFYARGLWGQYVICIPKKNMIIVRLGRNFGSLLDDGHHDDFYDFVDASLQMFPN